MELPECVMFWDVKVHNYVFIPKKDCKIVIEETSRGKKKRLVAEYETEGETRRVSRFVNNSFEL